LSKKGKQREMNVSFLRYCWVCANPYESVKAESRCCQKPECRMMLAEIDTLMMLQFILTNSRWAGGPGLETPEEMMQKAVKQLGFSSDPLAELLIELLCS
jgi:hypothetical protein